MSAMVYKWREQAGIKINAQVAGEYMEALRARRNGHLTPQAILEDAKSAKSPLHKAFEWRDSKAAYEHRLWQARHLMNSIVVTVKATKAPKQKAAAVRAFVNVRVEKKNSYVSRAHALSEADMRRQMLAAAMRELASWRNRHADLTELSPIFAIIDKHSEKIAA